MKLKQKAEIKINEHYYRGFEYARMHKLFVYINKNKLSKVTFFYSTITSSILGVLWCCLYLDRKFFFYIGKLNGIFANIKKIKVL